MHKPLIALAAGLLLAAPGWAVVQTVTLSVPSMNCPVCPITVKKALTQVSGVQKADVDLEKRQAKVTFDDVKTNVDVLTKATTNAGYPSTLVK